MRTCQRIPIDLYLFKVKQLHALVKLKSGNLKKIMITTNVEEVGYTVREQSNSRIKRKSKGVVEFHY